MATSDADLLATILQSCREAGAQPWYAADFVQRSGLTRAEVDEACDQLRLAGLLRLTDWIQGRGQGCTLTDAGHALVTNPHALQRLQREGAAAVPQPPPVAAHDDPDELPMPGMERATAIRDALLDPARPIVTFLLIALNVLNFGIGMVLAGQRNIPLNEYLSDSLGGPRERNAGAQQRLQELRHELGALDPSDITREEQWWRLLSCCFVHLGGLHLVMNMFALGSLGTTFERLWGPWRFLLLYLIAGLVGSATAVFVSPETGLLGASGAICGMLGSMLVWFLANRSYLPASYYSSAMRSLVMNGILIAFISSFPGVSGAGHYGGAAGGAAASLPLLLSRYGQGWQRWLGLLGTLLLPLLALGYLELTFFGDQPLDRAHRGVGRELRQADILARRAFNGQLWPLLEKQGKADNETLAIVLELTQAQQKLRGTIQSLQELPEPEDARVKGGVKIAREYLAAWDGYFQTALQPLQANLAITVDTRRELNRHMRSINTLSKELADSVFGMYLK